MSFLIAVSSCQRDIPIHAVIDETWGAVAKEYGIPYIITVGDPLNRLPDDWYHLACKTHWNVRRALEQGCEWMFQGFVDTFISIRRLANAYADLPVHADIIGNYFFHGVEDGGPCGGSGYWLSRRAMEVIAQADPTDVKSEDIWVARVLSEAGLKGFHDPRYDHLSMRGGVSLYNNHITNHLFSHYGEYQQLKFGYQAFDPDWLRQEQRQELTGELSQQNVDRKREWKVLRGEINLL
jgi:hypothetical protein